MIRSMLNKPAFWLTFIFVALLLHQAGSLYRFITSGYIMSPLLDLVFWSVLISGLIALLIWLVFFLNAKKTFIALFVFLAVNMVLLVPEVVIRIKGRELTYMERNGDKGYMSISSFRKKTWLVKREPNSKGRYAKKEFSQLWETNSLGYVDREWDRSATGLKVLALGDSFTEGMGGDDPWIKVLSDLLTDKCGISNYYMNGGISGHDPLLSYYNLEEELMEYEPDIVLLAVNRSDLDEIVARGCTERFKVNKRGDSLLVSPIDSRVEYLFAISHVARTLFRYYEVDQTLKSQEEKDADFELAKECLAIAIKRYQTLAEKEGFKFGVVFHPFIHNLFNNSMGEFDVTKQMLDNMQIAYVDLMPYYRDSIGMDRENLEQYFWQEDRHQKEYNSFANAVLAELGCAYFD